MRLLSRCRLVPYFKDSGPNVSLWRRVSALTGERAKRARRDLTYLAVTLVARERCEFWGGSGCPVRWSTGRATDIKGSRQAARDEGTLSHSVHQLVGRGLLSACTAKWPGNRLPRCGFQVRGVN